MTTAAVLSAAMKTTPVKPTAYFLSFSMRICWLTSLRRASSAVHTFILTHWMASRIEELLFSSVTAARKESLDLIRNSTELAVRPAFSKTPLSNRLNCKVKSCNLFSADFLASTVVKVALSSVKMLSRKFLS